IYGGAYNGGGSTDVQGSTVFLSTALNTNIGKNSVLNVGDTGFSGGMTAYNATGSGSRLNVYGLTPNGSGSGSAVVYELGYVTFNGSTLTFTPVPIPA